MADPVPVIAQVRVPFAETDLEGLTLHLEFSTDSTFVNDYSGWVAMRLFPNVAGVTAVASVGTVEYTGHVDQLYRNEFIIVQDSDQINAIYPIDNGSVEVAVIFAFDNNGNVINPNDLSFYATPLSNVVQSNIPFTGAVKLTYISSYRVYRYQPDGGLTHSGTGTFLYRNYGTVLMFRNADSVVLDIEGLGIAEPPEQNKEMYRVVSTVTTNEAGPWEVHPDFDSGSKWSDDGAPQKDDGEARQDWERVHEIGYIISGGIGRLTYETYDAPLEQGDGAGAPLMTYREANQSSFLGTIWMDSYNRVDKARAQSEAKARFSDSTFT